MVVLGLILLSPPAFGQSGDDWRVHFAAAEEARQAEDNVAYAAAAYAAAEAMPAQHLNRPFVQYHAARAAAMNGDVGRAVAWLRTAWEEDIEALMISFAPFDPAFAMIQESEAFIEVMALAAQMELSVTRLGGEVHLIGGAGSNILAHVSADGVFLVDTGYGPALPALREALSKLGADGVATLLVTHPHEDHMGATPDLGAEATVIAHPGTAQQMREPYVFMEGVETPPKPDVAMPDIELSRDTTITVGGEAIEIMPTVAHTAGDLSVYFTRSRVAHLGDAYLAGNPMMFPGNEDPDGFLDRLEGFLDGMHPETIVVGGHEAPVGLDAIRDQIEASRACMTFVRASIEEGMTLEATAEQSLVTGVTPRGMPSGGANRKTRGRLRSRSRPTWSPCRFRLLRPACTHPIGVPAGPARRS